MTVDYQCRECDHTFELFNVPSAFRNHDKLCPRCGCISRRVFIYMPKFTFAEGYRPVSSRSDSYWDNAERCRLEAKKKRLKAEAEKAFYDENYRTKKKITRKGVDKAHKQRILD